MKTLGIKEIIMYRDNGMYLDKYDVVYYTDNGGLLHKRYTIVGAMCDKHFNFILTHKCTPHYRKNIKIVIAVIFAIVWCAFMGQNKIKVFVTHSADNSVSFM